MAQDPTYKGPKLYYKPLAIPETTTERDVVTDIGGTATRVGVGLLPTALRIGSSWAGAPGGAWGAGAGAIGETLAQMVENRSMDLGKINAKRVAVEAGIGAIPFSAAFKTGKAASSALRGGALAAGGVAGRNLTDENPETSADPRKWGGWDVANVALGAGMGGVIGKMTKAAPASDIPKIKMGSLGPATNETLIQRNKWTPEQISTKAAKLESEGMEDAGHGLRVGARNLDVGDEKIYKEITRRDAKVAKEKQKTTDLAAKEAKQTAERHGRNEKARDAYVLRIGKAWDEANAEEQARREALKQANLVATRKADLESKGGKIERVARDQVKTVDPETGEVTTVTDTLKIPRGRKQKGSSEGPVGPVGPVTPRSGPAATKITPEIYKNLKSKGLSDEQIIALGPDQADEVRKISASLAPAVETPTTPVTAAVEKGRTGRKGRAPKTTPEAPPASSGPAGEFTNTPRIVTPVEAPPPPAKSPVTQAVMRQIAEQDVAERAAIRGTHADVGPDPSALRAEQARTGVFPSEEGLPPAPAKAPDTGGLATFAPEGAAPIVQESAGAGTQFARFFRNPRQAEFNRDIQKDMDPEAARALNNIWAQYEARLKGDPKKRALGQNIAQVRKSFGLASEKMPSPKSATKPPAQKASPAAPISPRSAEPPPAQDLPFESDPRLPQELIDRLTNYRVRAMEYMKGGQPAEIGAALDKEGTELMLAIDAATKTARSGERGAISPDVLMSLGSGAGGALVGAAMDDENPWEGAIIGGLGGAVAPSIAKSIGRGDLSPGKFKETATFLRDELPNIQRFNLLSEPVGLLINSVLAPYGAGVMGSIERVGTGLAERALGRPQTDAMRQGVGGLKELLNIPKHLKRGPEAWQQAKNILHGTEERGERLMSEATNNFQKGLGFPSTSMATGDLMTRTGLKDAGMSEELARRITVTANPRTKLGEGIVDFAKKSGPSSFLLPFSRTAVNVVESGMERMPLLHQAYNAMLIDPNMKATAAEAVAMYGISGAVAMGAYYLGQNIDVDTARQYQIPKIISNMAGQYGTIAAAAYAAGAANAAGQDQATAVRNSMFGDLPLPTTRPISDIFDLAAKIPQGEPLHPDAENPIQRWLPNSLVPGPMRDTFLQQFTQPGTGGGQGELKIYYRPFE